MLLKTGLFLVLLTVFQVSARYKNVVPDLTENEINSDSAATSSSRIVSGWFAQPGQFPHHAALRMFSPTGTHGTCGGAIVSRVWVLTAAQCTVGRVNIAVRVGTVTANDNNPVNIFETTEWYNFPTYDDSRPTPVQPNDIALVKLQRRLVYSRLVQPIRMQSDIDAYRNYDGEQVYISGHGITTNPGSLTNSLRWVYQRAISNVACAQSFPSGTIDNTIVCAQYYNVTAQSACRGDYGGPLVHVGSDSIPTLIGIFVFTTNADGTCPPGLPTGYTRPGPYLPWFRQVTGLDFGNLQEDDENGTTTTSSTSTTTLTPSTTTPVPSTTTISTTTTEPTMTTTTTTSVEPSTSTTTQDPTTSFTTSEATTTTTSTTTSDQDPTTLSTTPEPTTSTTSTTTSNPTIPDDILPEHNTTPSPDDSEEIEEDKEEDSDSSESNEDDDMAHLLKRLQVDVKVRVALNKYNVTKETGLEVNHHRH